jgi:hypothetical protein
MEFSVVWLSTAAGTVVNDPLSVSLGTQEEQNSIGEPLGGVSYTGQENEDHDPLRVLHIAVVVRMVAEGDIDGIPHSQDD